MTDKEKEKTSQDYSRRNFIKTAALTVGATQALSVLGMDSALAASESKNLSLAMAGYNFDRTRALIDGRVKIEGCDIQFQESAIGNINTHVFEGPQNYGVTEIGLPPFMLAFANDDFRDYSLLPIFPLRLFRHKSVFIRTDRGIEEPEDLKGKTIGTAGYASSSLTWMRGIFQDEYGVRPEDVHREILRPNFLARGPNRSKRFPMEFRSAWALTASMNQICSNPVRSTRCFMRPSPEPMYKDIP